MQNSLFIHGVPNCRNIGLGELYIYNYVYIYNYIYIFIHIYIYTYIYIYDNSPKKSLSSAILGECPLYKTVKP